MPVDLGFVIIRHKCFGRNIDLELRNHQSYHTLEDNLKKPLLDAGAYNSLEGSLLLRISLFTHDYIIQTCLEYHVVSLRVGRFGRLIP